MSEFCTLVEQILKTELGNDAQTSSANHCTATEPPAGLTLALAALWWDAKGDGRRAHESAQQDEGIEDASGAMPICPQRR